jgi:hypothetical protein
VREEVPPLSADQIREVLWNLVGSLRVRGFALDASRAYLEDVAASPSFWEAASSSRKVPLDDDAGCLITCNLGSLVEWCRVEDVHDAVRDLVRTWEALLARADAALFSARRQSARLSTREPS